MNAGAYLAQVIAGIQGSASSQTFFVVDMDSVVLSLDKAIPLALILNELITNALKYAYDETTPGSVSISLKAVDGQIRLIVADQGKGLPQGFEVRKNSSVGMRIIRSLAQQLKGDIAFVDGAPGLECRLLFAH